MLTGFRPDDGRFVAKKFFIASGFSDSYSVYVHYRTYNNHLSGIFQPILPFDQPNNFGHCILSIGKLMIDYNSEMNI